jgi:peroxiredoxin Q/BCP
MISAGDKIPAITLLDQDNNPIVLSSLMGRKVVIFFYPEDDTPGCTKEACSFRDSYAAIRSAGAEIFGVSMDGQKSHQKFREKYSLPFPLLVDDNAELARAFGVYVQKNMFGHKFWGVERSTFIIDAEGIVRKIFRRVNVGGHEKDVLTALREI